MQKYGIAESSDKVHVETIKQLIHEDGEELSYLIDMFKDLFYRTE